MAGYEWEKIAYDRLLLIVIQGDALPIARFDFKWAVYNLLAILELADK